MLTKLTMIASASRSPLQRLDGLVDQPRSRSYPVTISTPGGSEGAISRIFAFTPFMTLGAFIP